MRELREGDGNYGRKMRARFSREKCRDMKDLIKMKRRDK